MSEIDNLCYSYEQSIKAAMRFAWALAVAAAFVAFVVGFLLGKAGVGASVSPEMPRTIRLQLEVLGAGASAPTATVTANGSEATDA